MQDNSDLIIRDCCEAEVAEFGQPDTICITVDFLREIVQRHFPGTCLHQIQEPAAPVVLPEPALHVSGGQLERHCDPEDKNGGRYIPARKTAAGLFTTPLYTEQQVRALLAQAAIAAAPAHPAEGAQTDLHAAIMNIPVNKAKLEHLGINERLQYKIGHRDARHDAAELAVAHAAPQAQADARDALTHVELLEVKRAIGEFEDCNETDVPYALLMRAAKAGYLECTYFEPMSNSTLDDDIDRAAIAAAKGE